MTEEIDWDEVARAVAAKPVALNTIEEARKYLRWIDENIDPAIMTESQKEYRDKFEWAINNAHKLRAVFAGVADKGSIDDVKNAWVTIHFSLGAQGQSPSNMVH